MMHARISTEHDAFHFFGEVNPYNLETLRQHVRQTMHDDGGIRLLVEIEPADQRAFNQRTARWLPRLVATGTDVQIAVQALTCRTPVRRIGA